ncbi:RICIN domain-containing protein [Streptomyces sp. APSN-46.1]|uniref:RICIN domain-containing protein n=1 Tax=Streptomyces sp. APSN-46.1 TaxID=2929049 RepID=UPI001FB4E459|nr:RICIN domain-containing protein [Streptomyces sp. APSN-46.1]MCJ1679236.1 RICIN domain-containing protein [Streptomyces sp. APSN-46.1]
MHIARKSPYRLLLALLAAVGFTLLAPASPASAALSGQFFMKNQNSGMCMDVPGGTGTWGTQLIQWPCNGGANQNFYFDYVNGTPVLRNAANGLCIEVPGYRTDNGAPVVQWGCNGGENQRWYMTSQNSGVLGYYHNWTSKKCMEVADWRTDAGAPIRQWDCHFGKNQQFWNF